MLSKIKRNILFTGLTLTGLASVMLWFSNHKITFSYQEKTSPDLPTIEVVADHFNHPWSLAFLPDQSKLITERGGKLWWLSADNKQRAIITGLPPITVIGQGGLLDVVLHPKFSENKRIYFSYVESVTIDKPNINSLVAARAQFDMKNKSLTDVKVIFRQLPKVVSNAHFGGRLVFAKDNSLFIALGDRQTADQRGYAQDLSRHNGKIVRVLDDGRIPLDNPFLHNKQAKPEIWSYGHRNVQGVALHPQTGELWASEHGPQGGDEINLVKAGRNYGWPIISYGCEYGTCEAIGEGEKKEGMEQPLITWLPKSTAPSGLLFYTGKGFPEWQGQLFSGSLAGQTLWRMEVKNNKIIARHGIPLNMRIRDVRQGADGWLYLLTDENNGKLLKLYR